MLDAGVFQRLFVGVITGAHHRAAFDDSDADTEAELFQTGEFIRVHPAVDFEMLRRGLEILADGYDIGLVRRDVAQGLLNLVLFFTETQHDASLGRKAATLRMLEHGSTAVIASLHAHGPLQALHCLKVVIENIGFGI